MYKLITESSFDIDISESKNKDLYIGGVFSSAEAENANKRRYPKSLLEREIGKLLEEKVSNKCCFGELNHPPSTDISLDKVAIMVETLEWKNNDVWGRAKVLKGTPNGKILESILNDGGRVGISSRGLGTVGDDGYVNEDFSLLTYDIVSNPSNTGSWIQGIYEGKEFGLPRKPTIEEAKEEFKRHIWQVLENLKKEM